ncbi:MAG TPA: hypothetical protein VN421_09475 [Pseudoflavonifractor sp.]|nr:hypothetical protein [Pseudoflavonifractor sp.]
MTINEIIIRALEGFGDPVVPGLYTGKATRYYTFNYDLLPTNYAENHPLFERALIQVHFFAPLKFDSVRRRYETRKALTEAGLGYPETIDVSDRDMQHYVFECEAIIGPESEEENG